MPQEHIEEYLEAIYDIAGREGTAKTTEIAERLKNAPASVTEVFQRMKQKGLVRYESHKGVSLTGKGYKAAIKMKRKHRLLEVFLDKMLHLPSDKVHEQACKMEHTLTDETETALCKTLKGPTECPHGSPIPPCNLEVKNCQECFSEQNLTLEKRDKDIIAITALKHGEKAKIVFVRGGGGVMQRLCDLGLTNGTTISLLREAPMNGPVEICVRGCKLVIGRGIAEKIFVQKT
ncbi:MAG: metal-dependent transcriptional regulator [Candidatus Thermoplasmatota archaeon]|jgi:DtxR family Mn-dependent transcriptional regulator|nr:metal-dependent transcriptional regulator [Candidatus Thermoplasmatota archaeon]